MNDNDSTPKGDCFVSAPSEVDNKQIVHDAIAFNDDGHDSYKEAIQALPHLTDTAAFIRWLESMKEEDSPAPSVVSPRFNHPSTPRNEEYYRRLARNILIDTIIKELKP